MSSDSLISVLAVVGGGFFGGLLLGYAIKMAIRLLAVVAGLFIAGLAYLQYQHIALINWDKLEQALKGIVSTLVNATTKMIDNGNPEIVELAIANFGIPLTGTISIGFAIGFIKG